MATLTKKDFLKDRPLKIERVPVPEWGGDAIVQEMSAVQREKFEEWVLSKETDSPKGTRVAIIINTVVDENGKPLFSDLDAMDLGMKPAAIIDRIASAGLRLSGMKEDAVEEEVKNSETVPGEDSNSVSAEN